MRYLPEHKILSSFKEWFDHTLLFEGDAYINVTGASLYKMQNSNGFVSYGSPHQQWVYDQSISGAYIPTSNDLGVGYIDYRHGITLSGIPSSGFNYAFKELNIYTTTKTDQEFLFSSKFNTRPSPNYNPGITGLAKPNGLYPPCCILKPENTRSNEFQLGGGMIEKSLLYSAFIITDSEYLLHGVGNLFTDKFGSCFPILTNLPLNKYGDYKTGSFNYIEESQNLSSTEDLIFIKNVSFSSIEHDSISKAHPDLYFGKLSFDLKFFKGINRVTNYNYLSDDDSAWLEDI